jgi:hypothetical protein
MDKLKTEHGRCVLICNGETEDDMQPDLPHSNSYAIVNGCLIELPDPNHGDLLKVRSGVCLVHITRNHLRDLDDGTNHFRFNHLQFDVSVNGQRPGTTKLRLPKVRGGQLGECLRWGLSKIRWP